MADDRPEVLTAVPPSGAGAEAGGAGAVSDAAAPDRPPALSIAEAKALLAARHSVAVGDDDPVLMLVTLHEGFVSDHERLLERHRKALEAVMASATAAMTEAMGESLSAVADEVVSGVLPAALARAGEEARQSEAAIARFRAGARRLTVTLTLLNGLSWLALGAAVLVLARG